jgi:hypothetical protein
MPFRCLQKINLPFIFAIILFIVKLYSMKHLYKPVFLFAFIYFLFTPGTHAQVTVAAKVGYPVGTAGKQVAYGNSKYVLLSSNNFLYQSSDASSWSEISTSGLSGTPLNYIVYGNGVFVTVGNNGVIQTSTDGINWTTRASGTTNNLNKVYYINSKFFAIGFNRTLLTSSDAINWTAIAFNAGSSSDFFMSLAYGNGWYVLAARNNSGSSAIVYRSSTATDNSWSYATDTPAFNGINRIQFLNDKFWAFMIGNRMFTSSDGGSWTEITNSVVLTQPNGTTTSWNTSHQIFNGVWDGTKYSFYGSSQYYAGYGSTFTSTDGTNFTLLNKTAYIVPQESTILNGIYFVCGNEGFVTSTDGSTYNHSGFITYDMVKTANKYVSVGAFSNDGTVYNSSDFSTWTNRTPQNVRELYTTAYDGTRVLAAGYQNILSSTDEGNTWTNVYQNVNEGFTAMAYGNGRFVVGGYNSTGAFLRYSTDGGQTWTTANTDNNYYLKIKYVNNKFFALGMNNDDWLGRIMYSTDGINWTDVTPNTGFEVYYYKDVAFDGSKYHVFGIESTSWTPVGFFTLSTTTPGNAASYANKAVCNNTPSGVVLGGNWDEGLLDYGNGEFTGAVIDVNTGQDYIIYSADGSSWTALPQNSYSTIIGSYQSGTTVQMIGRGNATFTVSYGITLPVSLATFDGKLYQSSVKLNWTTESEQNTKQFMVQRSADGSNWKDLGTVAAAGNSDMKKEYHFTDANPVQGNNFYRLLTQDIDGKFSISRVITIALNGVQISWYPNPVNDEITIRSAKEEQGRITIFNTNGQAVKTSLIQGHQTRINVAELPRGIYIVQMPRGHQTRQITFVKN